MECVPLAEFKCSEVELARDILSAVGLKRLCHLCKAVVDQLLTEDRKVVDWIPELVVFVQQALEDPAVINQLVIVVIPVESKNDRI
jgi:hypothetical protein